MPRHKTPADKSIRHSEAQKELNSITDLVEAILRVENPFRCWLYVDFPKTSFTPTSFGERNTQADLMVVSLFLASFSLSLDSRLQVARLGSR